MINIKEYLPFLDGWEAVLDVREDITVTNTMTTLIFSREEKGWLLGAVAAVSNKYVLIDIEIGHLKLPMHVQKLYILGYRHPVKPGRSPYVLWYQEDSPGSETGYFVTDFDPIDWESYVGDYRVVAQLPRKVKLPNGTTVTVSASSATLHYFALLRIRIKDIYRFFSSLNRVYRAIMTGRAEILMPTALKEVEKLKEKREKLRAMARW